jgi:hypothetical protein
MLASGRSGEPHDNDADFRGFSAVTQQNVPDLRAWQVQGYNNKSWNNRISSMRLN